MIGIDTSVLVRYLTLDDVDQVERVDRLVQRALERDEALHVDGVVLCETAWVLRTAYDLPRSEIAEAFERILDTRQFAIEDRDAARRRSSRGSPRARPQCSAPQGADSGEGPPRRFTRAGRGAGTAPLEELNRAPG